MAMSEQPLPRDLVPGQVPFARAAVVADMSEQPVSRDLVPGQVSSGATG
jgi:hypothetical protein